MNETMRQTILVVDDDEGVRSVIATVLQLHGFLVREADSGAMALQVAAAHAEPIHLLLVDLVMLNMNGLQLAQQLKQTRPEIRVLFITEYPDPTLFLNGTLPSDAPLLHKPFSITVLINKVNEVLGP